MVETAARNGCDISTGQLDECRDRFSDILYAGSDRSEIGVDAMKDAVENAVAYYEGNITPSMEIEFSASSREDLRDSTRHGEPGGAEYRETGHEDHGAEFNRLEIMDEFAVGERIHRMLDAKLHHTTELAGEMAAQENPNLPHVENINETFRQIIHAGIMQSVENGDTEQFSTIMENLNQSQGEMYISLDRTVGRPQLGRKGDMRRRGILEIVFKTPGMHIPPWYWFRRPVRLGVQG